MGASGAEPYRQSNWAAPSRLRYVSRYVASYDPRWGSDLWEVALHQLAARRALYSAVYKTNASKHAAAFRGLDYDGHNQVSSNKAG